MYKVLTRIGAVAAGGPAPGTTVSAKDLASDSTKREWAAADNAPLAGDTVAAAHQSPTLLGAGRGVGTSHVILEAEELVKHLLLVQMPGM